MCDGLCRWFGKMEEVVISVTKRTRHCLEMSLFPKCPSLSSKVRSRLCLFSFSLPPHPPAPKILPKMAPCLQTPLNGFCQAMGHLSQVSLCPLSSAQRSHTIGALKLWVKPYWPGGRREKQSRHERNEMGNGNV